MLKKYHTLFEKMEPECNQKLKDIESEYGPHHPIHPSYVCDVTKFRKLCAKHKIGTLDDFLNIYDAEQALEEKGKKLKVSKVTLLSKFLNLCYFKTK